MAPFSSPARRVRPGLVCALALTALVSGLLAAPAVAAPDSGTTPFYRVAPRAFTIAPSVGAPIGDTVVLWREGSATATVDLPGPAVRLVFEARAQACEGAPRLEVRIDDVAVFGSEIGGTGSYAVAGSWTAGPHKVALGFSQDHLGAACDRNIKVRSVAWQGPNSLYGAQVVYVSQQMDMRAVAFAPVSAGATYEPANPGFGSIGAAMLWTTGSFTGTLTSHGAEYLYVESSGNPCAGWPLMRLEIDGELVTEQVVVPDRGQKARRSWYSTPGSWKDGPHTVTVSYLNDKRTATCDRNLGVLGVTFTGSV